MGSPFSLNNFFNNYDPDFFSQQIYDIEWMSGKKIKVIGLLENFLDDFEKKNGIFEKKFYQFSSQKLCFKISDFH